jgi:transcriptional regulator with GAF, ATPase, and Fis domain
MNSLHKKLSVITSILFIIGIVGVTYYFYQTSTALAYTLQIREVHQIALIEKTLQPLSIVISIDFFMGVSAILLLLLHKQKSGTDVIQNKDMHAEYSAQTDAFKDAAHTDKRVEIVRSKLQATYPDTNSKLEKVLTSICNEVEACQGAIFQAKRADNKRFVEMCASFAYFKAESKSVSYEFGEGLTGQVAKEGKLINISTVPEGYVTIISGLGNSSPKHLMIVPVKLDSTVVGVIEIASFKTFTKADEDFLNELSPLLGNVLSIQYSEEAIA